MSREDPKSGVLRVLGGMLLLGVCHVIAVGGLVILSYLLEAVPGMSTIILVGVIGFFFWQLIYVIPLTLWLRRKREHGLMKGVIIGAVITALLCGTCSVWGIMLLRQL